MRFAILVFPGSSCDVDAEHAVKEVLQEEADLIWHLDSKEIANYDALIIPNGAAFGGYLRPGALAKATTAMEDVHAFVETGKPVLGLGNGFHILTEAGILPGAFLQNNKLKFEEGIATLTVENAESLFTAGYEKDQKIEIPYANQHGNYYADAPTVKQLQTDNRIVFTYEKEASNGSTEEIAAILNDKGNVLGIMPLPERAVEEIIGSTDGLALFESILKGWSE